MLLSPNIHGAKVYLLSDSCKTEGTCYCCRKVFAVYQDHRRVRALSNFVTVHYLNTNHPYSQRIDLFGAKKQDLPNIWEQLGLAGFESGHAYGKALRTVKSCVGTSWCRFGVGDSVGLAVELEERYKGIRAPHKFKGGVSGCVRECAEAQGKGPFLHKGSTRLTII